MGNLTAMKLRNLKEPGRYSDGDGLMLVSTKSGKGSWIVRVQANGRRRDIGIGPYPDVSLADAREAAAAVRKQAKAGIDVVAERRKEADPVPTFRQAAVRVVLSNQTHRWRNVRTRVGHEDATSPQISQPFPVFQLIAGGDPSGCHDVRSVSAEPSECRRLAFRAWHRHLPRNCAAVVEQVRPDVRQ